MQVVVLAVVELAEHPLEQHLREADDGVQRGPQLVRHARQELRLVPARLRQVTALLLELLVQPGVGEGDGRLAGERLQELLGLGAERAGGLATHHHRADHPVSTEHRHCQQRPPAGVVQDRQVGVAVDGGHVDDLDRRPGRPGSPDHRLVEVDAGRPQGVQDRRARPVGRPDAELVSDLVVLHERAAVRPRQLDGEGHDGGEHLVGVEAGAHGLPYLGQRLELLHAAGELGRACFQGAEQLDVAQREGPLRRERGEHRAGALVERLHDGAPHRQDPDGLAVHQHRGAHDRPVPAAALELEDLRPRVPGIGQHVGDLLGRVVEEDAPDQRLAIARDRRRRREVQEVRAVARRAHQVVLVAAHQVDLGDVGRHSARARSTMTSKTSSAVEEEIDRSDRIWSVATSCSLVSRSASTRWWTSSWVVATGPLCDSTMWASDAHLAQPIRATCECARVER